jgi:lactoylglutathione lyase/glyoxylase I family protein
MKGHHAAVRVPDFEISKNWFVDKLDWRVLIEWASDGMDLAYLAPPDDDSFRIEIMAGPGASPRVKYDDLNSSLVELGFHHVCLTVDSLADTLDELKMRGVTLVGEVFELPVISARLAFIADPWGNLIELSERIVPTAMG